MLTLIRRDHYCQEGKLMSDRPLSPHLQIYSPMLTMMMSMAHRLTGMALYFGTVLLVWWLLAAATGPAAYETFLTVAGSIPGLIVLFGFTWALLHHLLGGLRHFIWDTGRGFDLPDIELLARATLGGSLVLTLVIWAAGIWL